MDVNYSIFKIVAVIRDIWLRYEILLARVFH